MRHGLHGIGVVLMRISSAALGLDVQESGSSIIGQYLIAVVVEAVRKFVVMPVRQAV